MPAGSDAALAAPASPRGPSVVRQPEEAEEPQPKRSAVEAQRGEKRPADTPVEDIDPQVGGGSVLGKSRTLG